MTRDSGLRWCDGGGIPLLDVDFDTADRVIRRTWHGRRAFDYGRDDRGRLVTWTETPLDSEACPTVHARQYVGDELSGLVTDGVRTVVRCDDGGRIRKLIGPMRTVGYEYDANGRRSARVCRDHVTTYRYDELGQLVAVTSPDGTVEYGWDALGRRIFVAVGGIEYREHRDPTGRLWAVTTATGAPVCRFLWWNGRVIARCDADDEIDELYLTDPFGTVLGVADASTGWRFDDAIGPPFGHVDAGAGWRPTLFGHIADGHTSLICFGARELDPETGSFLTPDPWHGEPDDPRRLAGQPAATLPKETARQRNSPVRAQPARPAESTRPRRALRVVQLRPDPDARPDVGRHAHLVIAVPVRPAELLCRRSSARSAYFGGRHFWPQHSIFGLRLATGSSRLGTMGLALNGFVPRGFAGVGGDRCITIGHVAWESRHYFHQLDRARVLELDDIAGTPKADGTPDFGPRRFSDTSGGSILVITSTDTDRRGWVCGRWWTRGPGNAVGLRGTTVQSFEDRAKPGETHVRGTIYLAHPMPESMPAPREAGDGGTLKVDEYLAGAKTSTAKLVPAVWFAVDAPSDPGISTGTVLGVSAGDGGGGLWSSDRPGARRQAVAILDHDLPDRFTKRPDLRGDVVLQKLTVSAVTSAGWALRSGATKSDKLDLAAPPHPVAVGDVFRCAPAGGAPAERPNAYTAVEAVTMALTVSPTLGGATVAELPCTALRSTAPRPTRRTHDPAGHPTQLSFARDQPFAVGALVRSPRPGSRPGTAVSR